MDYLGHWSLLQRPFAHDASRRFYCGSPQREFIAGLNYLAVREQRSAVLSCGPGCGTTSLLRHVAQTSGLGDCAVEVFVTDGDQSSEPSVLAGLAEALGLSHLSENPIEPILATIQASARQSVRTVWLIDRCDDPAAQVASELTECAAMLSVVLAGDCSTAESLTAMLSRDAVRTSPMQMDLEPLSLADTADYVRHSLHMAGGSPQSWSDTAIVRLHEIGQGRLAEMSQAAESAMELAARHQMDEVGPEIVEATQEPLARATQEPLARAA